MADPDWLTWTRELQAIAQTGLAFGPDDYDRERYEMLRSLASRMMAAHTSASAERIEALFAAETGYATPKVDVRGAVFDGDDRLLMVREVADGGRWTLPGGWADVNLTPAENVVKEVRRGERLQGRGAQARRGVGPDAAGTFLDRLLLLQAVLRLRHRGWRRRDRTGNVGSPMVSRERPSA